jgi:hypothetical protein
MKSTGMARKLAIFLTETGREEFEVSSAEPSPALRVAALCT